MPKSWGRLGEWRWYVSAAMSGEAHQRVYVYRNLSTGKIVRAVASPMEFKPAQFSREPAHPSPRTGRVVVVDAQPGKTDRQTGNSERTVETEGWAGHV